MRPILYPADAGGLATFERMISQKRRHELERQLRRLCEAGAVSFMWARTATEIESAFNIKIPEDELWKGSFDGTDPDAIERGVARLRERVPDFRWDRLPARLTRDDLPRLITVRTIVEYLERRGVGVTAGEA